MNSQWNFTTVTNVCAAVYVAKGTGRIVHRDRAHHGFVINDSESIKEYYFDDGRVMRTNENCIFYLPRGSSYRVVHIRAGGCYAINFDADISDEPFCMLLRNNDRLLHSFKDAVNLYMNRDELANAAMMRAVYEFIYCAQKEMKKRYIPSNRTSLIAPAIEAIEGDFTDSAVTVSALADMCGMSEVYFRRLFLGVYGVSPKEYIIQKRIEYAKSLLRSGSFSVAQTAELCGYAEPCHFSREFTKRTGIAPSRYMLDLQHGAKI